MKTSEAPAFISKLAASYAPYASLTQEALGDALFVTEPSNGASGEFLLCALCLRPVAPSRSGNATARKDERSAPLAVFKAYVAVYTMQ